MSTIFLAWDSLVKTCHPITLLAPRHPVTTLKTGRPIYLVWSSRLPGGGRTRTPAVKEEQLQVLAVLGQYCQTSWICGEAVVRADKHPRLLAQVDRSLRKRRNHQIAVKDDYGKDSQRNPIILIVEAWSGIISFCPFSSPWCHKRYFIGHALSQAGHVDRSCGE